MNSAGIASWISIALMKTKSPMVCSPRARRVPISSSSPPLPARKSAPAEVQPARATSRPASRPLVTLHRLVEALRLHLLVAEIFHGLENSGANRSLGLRIGVAVVIERSNGDAPVTRTHRKPDVEPYRDSGHRRLGEAVAPPEDHRRSRNSMSVGTLLRIVKRTIVSIALGATLDDGESPPVRRSR